jgi:hypothetical protein
MKLLSRISVLFVVVATVVTVSLSAQGADSWVGTWRLNLAKSKYESGPPPQSAISRLERSGDGWKMSQDLIDAQGRATHTELQARFDGKDYPVEGVAGLTYAFTRIDDHTYDLITKRGGIVAGTTRTVVSSDGQTRTSTTAAKNAQGQTVTNVAVYDRQ